MKSVNLYQHYQMQSSQMILLPAAHSRCSRALKLTLFRPAASMYLLLLMLVHPARFQRRCLSCYFVSAVLNEFLLQVFVSNASPVH